MNNGLLEAARAKYQAEILECVATLEIYFTNAVAIGEHPDLVAAVDNQIDKMAHAEDKLEILKKYYNGYTSTN